MRTVFHTKQKCQRAMVPFSSQSNVIGDCTITHLPSLQIVNWMGLSILLWFLVVQDLIRHSASTATTLPPSFQLVVMRLDFLQPTCADSAFETTLSERGTTKQQRITFAKLLQLPHTTCIDPSTPKLIVASTALVCTLGDILRFQKQQGSRKIHQTYSCGFIELESLARAIDVKIKVQTS